MVLLSIFGLFIYLEILELNIFKLNENTRRAISQRGEKQVKEDLKLLNDILGDENEDDENKMVEVSPGYLIKVG